MLAKDTGRISTFDTAKGLCLLFIIAGHVGVRWMPYSAFAVRVMLFFVISGFFFSSDLQPKAFIVKKVKRLIIPFLCFYFLSYGVFYVSKYLLPDFETFTQAKGILDLFNNKRLFNGPLWFLPVLFFVGIISYGIERLVSNEILRAVLFVIPGVAGYTLAAKCIDLPIFLDTALTAMPFFYSGILLRQINFHKLPYKLICVFVVAILSFFIYSLFPFYADMAINRYDCSMLRLFCVGYVICAGYLSCAYLISKYVPILNDVLGLIGYHSLYIMCTHHIVYRFFEYILSGYLNDGALTAAVFFFTFIICLSTAPLVEKYLPALVGK